MIQFAGAFEACKMMRSAVLFLLIISSSAFAKTFPQGASDALKHFIAAYSNECQGTCKISEKIVSQWTHNGEVPDNHDFKCFVKCIHENLGITNQNGTVNREVLEGLVLGVPGGNAEMLAKCLKGITGVKDPYEVSYKLAVCFTDAFSV